MNIIGITGGVGCGKSRVLDYIEENYRACVLKADEMAQELKLPGQPCYEALIDLLGEEVLEEAGTDTTETTGTDTAETTGTDTTETTGTDTTETTGTDTAETTGTDTTDTTDTTETTGQTAPGSNRIPAANSGNNTKPPTSPREHDRRPIDNRKMAQKIFSDPQILQQVNAIMHPAVKTEILRRIKTCEDSGLYDLFFLEAALLIEEGYMEIVDRMWYIYADEPVRRKRMKESRGYSDDKIDSIMKSQLTEDEFRKSCQVVIDNSGDWEQTQMQIQKALQKL